MAKLHFSRQRYCFFRTYASAKHIFFIKSHISPLFLLRFHFANGLGKYLPPLHSTQKKSHSPCAYAILLLPLRSNLLYHYLLWEQPSLSFQQLWNTNLVLDVVLHLFVSTRIPLNANVQAWNSHPLLVHIWLRNTPTNASAASACWSLLSKQCLFIIPNNYSGIPCL